MYKFWHKIIAQKILVVLKHPTEGVVWGVCVVVISGCLLCCSFSATRSSRIRNSKSSHKISFVPQEIDISGNRVAIPFKLDNDWPVVEAYVNGQGPYNFLLDTGSTGLMLSPELVAQLNLPVVRVKAVLHMRKGKRNLGHMRRVSLIELGDVKFHKVDAAVVSTNNISQSTAGKVYGVFGLQVFAHCRLTIDYLNREIILETHNDTLPLSAEDVNVLPLKSFDVGLVAVPVTVNEKNLWCMIDTGSVSGIDAPYKAAATFPLVNKPVWVPGSTRMFYGLLPKRKARLKGSALIGPNEFLSPIICFQGEKTLIGSEILKHFVVTIDQQRMLARFVRKAGGPVESPPAIRHHGFVFSREDGLWVVTGAIKGLNLDQLSLKFGDRIKMVDNKPVSTLTNEQLQALVGRNAALKLSILREGRELTIDVPVTKLVP